MSMKEINQISIFNKLIDREIKQKEAAVLLNLSERQVNRKLKNFKKQGPKSLVHGSRGKPSSKKTDPLKLELIGELLVNKYYDCGPTLAAEFLSEHEGIEIHHEVLRRYMISENIDYKKRKSRSYRKMRQRKDHFGHMIQLDGSIHMWFESKQKYYTLLLFIDDATSKILYMEFVDAENTNCLMEATYNYIKKYGMPLAFYTDRGKVFKVNNNNKNGDKLTQYEWALKRLGITLIHARSPQAKGRVERSFGTHQDRLCKEMRIRDIDTPEEANKFISEYYLDKHNKKFAKEPRKEGDLHRPIEEGHDLELIFSKRTSRVLSNNWTIQYKWRIFQLSKKQVAFIRPKDEITIHEHFSGKIRLSARNIELRFKEATDRPRPTIIPAKVSQRTYIPPKNHPWRTTNSWFYAKTRHFHCGRK